MKKLFLLVACVAMATSVWAGDTPKKPSCKGFVTNGFWDNWELSAGAGVGTTVSNGGNVGSITDRLGFVGEVSLTKWVHPVFGVRGQLQGGKNTTLLENGTKGKWPYMFVHVDGMVNLSNWIGGYREDRAYYAVPFAGFGYMVSNFTDDSQRANDAGRLHSYAFSFGLLNKFRVSKSVDLNLELKSLLAPSAKVSPVEYNGAYLFGLSATAGVTYRFNQRNWQRGVAGYTADDIKAFQDAVANGKRNLADAEAEKARLQNELDAARKEAADARAAADAAARAAANRPVAEPTTTSVIFYDYNVSSLTDKERTRLELVADVIKDGPANRVYRIEGHADKQTGTTAGNQRISNSRAKKVFDFLVSKGVNPDQLTYEGKGDKEEPYKYQKANRSVIIK